MQIQTSMGYHFTLRKKIINVSEDMKKSETSYIAGGKVKWLSHGGKQCGSSSNFKHRMTTECAIPILSIFAKQLTTGPLINTCRHIVMAALSPKDKRRKRRTRLSAGDEKTGTVHATERY